MGRSNKELKLTKPDTIGASQLNSSVRRTTETDGWAVIDVRWLLYLAIPAAWTIFFSMFSKPGIRGWRNLGWPTCYMVGIAMLWSLGWVRAGATWLCVGFTTGLLYYVYEVVSSKRSPDPERRAQVSTVLNGAAAWPIMLPEVIEYSLADLGILKANSQGTPANGNEGGVTGRGHG